MENDKYCESTITQDIIDKVHISLANQAVGEELITFIRNTEKTFMDEVQKFTRIELDRLPQELPEHHRIYVATTMTTAYLLGFLIAREADHKLYHKLLGIDSILSNSVPIEKLDELMDKYKKNGKSNKEIGGSIKKYLMTRHDLINKSKQQKLIKKVTSKRLKIGDLDNG